MKVAIFGGSFNPWTEGHSRLANYIVQNNVVDFLLAMPCYRSLYNKGLEPGEHRLKMIELAKCDSRVQPLDWEIKNKIEGRTTYDIMSELKREFEGKELYFVMGLDNSQKIKKWPNGENIIKEFNFIVVPRIGTNTEDIWFMDKPHVWLGNYVADEISSTNAKRMIASHTPTKEVLDPAVYDYIIEQNLYKGETP